MKNKTYIAPDADIFRIKCELGLLVSVDKDIDDGYGEAEAKGVSFDDIDPNGLYDLWEDKETDTTEELDY